MQVSTFRSGLAATGDGGPVRKHKHTHANNITNVPLSACTQYSAIEYIPNLGMYQISHPSRRGAADGGPPV